MRAALNRAANALSKMKNIEARLEKVTKELANAQREYYKLARRAAMIPNANLKSGRLTQRELGQLRTVAATAKNIATAVRTLRYATPRLNYGVKEKIAKMTIPR